MPKEKLDDREDFEAYGREVLSFDVPDNEVRPERIDPFGSRDRKMANYLIEDNDSREERTGYLYIEFKSTDSETYLTIGIGMRVRRGNPIMKIHGN